MVFNSIEFLIFLPIVVLLFYVLPQKLRWLMLLAASCVFYMWFVPKYILILLVTIVIDFSAGVLMDIPLFFVFLQRSLQLATSGGRTGLKPLLRQGLLDLEPV